MIAVTIYVAATGAIRQVATVLDAAEADINCAPGEAWILGAADLARDHVVSGEIVAKPPATPNLQRAWAALRAERTRRLAASDWTQIADAPVDQVAWAAYRAALRALPENTTDPLNPAWPTAPATA